MGKNAIEAKNLSKAYRMWANHRARLSGALASRVAVLPFLPGFVRRRVLAYRDSVCHDFYALRDINISVPKGETVGIIGRNGSGKSTVLKIIAGILRPTTGSVEVNGRVAAMLELAAGFEQEFTGRENVYMSASIRGLSNKEIDERFDDIVAFADIGEFLDQPVKTYSSGMLVRLAFAVHTSIDPEILIVDEALAVGDETFRRKCFARLEKLREKGTTILFVSHDVGSVVNLTQYAYFFHQGEIVLEGDPKEVASEYQRFCHAPRSTADKIITELKSRRTQPGGADGGTGKQGEGESSSAEGQLHTGKRKGGPPASKIYDPNLVPVSTLTYDHHGGVITGFRLTNHKGKDANLLERNQWYTFTYDVRFYEQCHDVTFAMLIKTMKGHELGGSRTLPWDQFIEVVEAGDIYRINFKFQTLLMPGTYFLNAGVEGRIDDKRAYVHRVVDALCFKVKPHEKLMPTGTVDFLIEPSMEVTKDSVYAAS